MTENLPERNWNITSIGALSVILIALGFLIYLSSSIPLQRPILMAVAAGIIFAISSKIGDLDKIKALMKPLSGFLNMTAGAVLFASLLLFYSSSLQIALETFNQFEGDSIISLVRAVILPIIGYSVVLFGSFLSGTGSSLIFWDRVDERVPVRAERTDFLFTSILGGLTLIGIFGTAFLKQLPLGNYLQSAAELLVSTNSFSTITAGILIFITYRAGRSAWKALPIRESVPRKNREQYDKLGKPEKVVRLLIIPALSIGTALQGFVNINYLNYLSVLSSSGLRTLYIGIIVVSITIYLAVKVLKTVTEDRQKIKRLIPYTIFGIAAYMLAPFLGGYIQPLIAELPANISGALTPIIQSVGITQFAMIVMTLASGAAVILKMWMGILRAFGLVPKGLEGTTLVASGIFFSSIGIHLYAPNPVVLFIGVAASMASWELGKRSVILGREIGHSGSTYQAELVQLVSKLFVGLLAVIAARTALVAVRNAEFSVPVGTPGFVVFILTLIGISFLTASMKEFT